MEGYIEIVNTELEKEIKTVQDIGKFLTDNPETEFEEQKAHSYVTDTLQTQGFRVQRQRVLKTAFRAEFGDGKPVVALICEYDALPIIGHANGNNLVAVSAVAAAIAVKGALQKDPSLKGKIVVIGTPGSVGGEGKPNLIERKVFEDVDLALMAHPGAANVVVPASCAHFQMNVEYNGISAHAGGFPWKGVNALDAAMAAYTFVTMLQRRMRHVWKIVGYITDGGSAPNVIPDMTKMVYDLKAPNFKQLLRLKERLEDCLTSGGDGARCMTSMTLKGHMLKDVMKVSALANVYKRNAERLGMKFTDADKERVPEVISDAGNLSYVVPMIRPIFELDTQAKVNTKEFADAAGTSDALGRSVVAAKALALTAIQVMKTPTLYKKIRKEFLAAQSKAS